VVDFPLIEVKEGAAHLVVPDLEAIAPGAYPTHAPVFYNPDMVHNRDISLLVYKQFLGGKGSVLDMLAATGVRSVRAALEAGATRVVACDAKPAAVELIRANIERNDVSDIVEAVQGDARAVVLGREWFDIIDVDPFGCPTPFLQGVSAAIRPRRGLIGVSATDGAVLCGVHPKVCMRKYGSRSLKTPYCHELAIRIMVYASALPLLRDDYGVRPVLSHASIHFFRIYLETRKGKARADATMDHIGYVAHCMHCGWRGTGKRPRELCPGCGKPTAWAGPLWTGPLNDKELVSSLVDQEGLAPDAQKLLEKLSAEPDIPLFYDLHALGKDLVMDVPRTSRVMDALREQGYTVGPTHLTGSGVKTDAEMDAVKDAMRAAAV